MPTNGHHAATTTAALALPIRGRYSTPAPADVEPGAGFAMGRGTATATKPGILDRYDSGSPAVQSPTRCGAHAAIPSANTISIPTADTTFSITRNRNAVCASISLVLPTTGYGRRSSYVSNAAEYGERDVYHSPSDVDAATDCNHSTGSDGGRQQYGAYP